MLQRSRQLTRYVTTVLIVVLLALVATPGAGSTAPVTWYQRRPQLTGNQLTSVAYGNGVYVAVGRQGTVLTSPDGVTWSLVSVNPAVDFGTVTFGNGLFVVVGADQAKLPPASPDQPEGAVTVLEGGTEHGFIYTSTDGETWVKRLQSEQRQRGLNAVTYGGGRFVAVGYGGTVYTSVDGVDWIDRSTGAGTSLHRVAYGNGRFVASGIFGALFTTQDGSTWRAVSLGTDAAFVGMTYADGKFVATATGNRVFTSTDGVTWQQGNTPTVPNKRGDDSILAGGLQFHDGRWLALDTNCRSYTSRDGLSWELLSANEEGFCSDLVYGKDRWVAVGAYGSVLTSGDGKDWNRLAGLRSNSFLREIAYGNGQWVAVGDAGCGVLTSADGAHWVERTVPDGSGQYGGVTFVNGRFFITNGTPAVSANGLDWRNTTRLATRVPQTLAFGNGTYASPPNPFGQYLVSKDGVTWTLYPDGPKLWTWGIAFGAGRFVGVGEKGMIVTSEDGRQWSTQQSGTRYTLWAVTYGQGLFVAVGNGGTVLTSPDGLTWTRRSTEAAATLRGVAYGDGRFMAVGDRDIITSADGIHWDWSQPPSEQGLTNVAWGDGYFGAVNWAGHVATTGGPSAPNTVTAQGQPDHVSPGMSMVTANATAAPATGARGVTITVSVRDDQGQPLPGQRVRLERTFGQSSLRTNCGFTDANGQASFRVLSPREPVQTVFTARAGADQVALPQTVAVDYRPCGSMFADVSGSRLGCRSVETLAMQQVVTGYPDGTFGTDRPVTRAEVAKLLTLALGLKPQPETSVSFSDVNGHWAVSGGYVQAAAAAKVFSGFPDGTFRPDEPVTRAQLVKLAAAALGLTPGGKAGFPDVPADAWYSGWIAAADQAALIGRNGIEPVYAYSTFEPDRPASRIEAAMVLMNLMELR